MMLAGCYTEAVPNPQTLMLSVVARLVDDPTNPAQLLALGDAAAILKLVDHSLTAIFTPGFGPAAAIGDKLQAIVQDNPGIHIKLVLIGGGDPLREQLPRGGGMLSRRAVQLFHLGPGASAAEPWTVWTGGGARTDSPVGATLQAAAKGELPTVDQASVAARVDAPPPQTAEERQQVAESRAFIAQLGTRPVVTWGILAVLATIFGLEMIWGGSESIPTLVRMGGNLPDGVSQQPWRLLSSALLHAGPLHVAVNGYVLLVLGGFMEKILGRGRYAVLLGAAALGGSLVSAMVSSAAVSVGASGAIWGVLGAAAALAWRPGDTIPATMVGPLRRNAMINLVINLSVSFMPQVDLWAHLGGGLAGAGLVLGGVLLRDLPRPGAQTTDGTAQPPPSDGRRWTIAAGLVAGVMGASLALAWITGQPWQLSMQPQFTSHRLADGVEVTAPALLGAPAYERDATGSDTWTLGDPLGDPLALAVVVTPHALDPLALADYAEHWAQAGPAAPPDAVQTIPWSQREGVSPPTFVVEYRYPNGLVSGIWIQLRPDAKIRLESIHWPTSDERWARAVARAQASLEGGSSQSSSAIAPVPQP